MNQQPADDRREQRRLRAQQVQIRVLANKQFMDSVYQAMEDERLGKGVPLKNLKRPDGGH